MNKKEIIEKKNTIDDLKKQLDEKEKIRDELNDQIYELRDTIRTKESELQIYDYYNSVRNFLNSANNYEDHYLRRDTSTREMMTRLKRGHYTKENYIFQNGKYVSTGENKHYVDYYIINNRYILLYSSRLKLNFIPPIAESYTATEFKQYPYISNYCLKSESENMTIQLKNGKKIYLYTKSVELCGQTYDDMDYRKEWYNGELEYEGNNYGDTSTFYFIGELM